MSDQERQGPAIACVATVKRIITLLAGMVETRVKLAVVELEQEKSHLIQLLLLVGLTLIFTTFGLMCLIALVIWSLEPEYRLLGLCWITGILLGLAVIGGLWALLRARRTTLLKETRKELANDRALLEEKLK
ncbi:MULTISPECIES: phage holin family protein [Lonsdalea]|uniref:Uncharacterized protein n=2 Tax=Lonsdalea TaxID=1082702 RepID=A0ACD1JAW3_9GAMM|nr:MULTISPECIES: phage holin family protein [Lonsdalea]OSM95782.1 hypothetical protein AU499_14920 [Lonsdalea populi]OSM96646.1 hypothetical protein AU508_08640 [Lonsdalea populi]QPQ23781.1 phage holin family protein [Lonsdalea populi]RAT12419.1 hypothetical protein AU485_11690 [Lonsdalea quercina]RAT12509.1 hypothetical protein AU486_15960 [Lonsdalea quercina]